MIFDGKVTIFHGLLCYLCCLKTLINKLFLYESIKRKLVPDIVAIVLFAIISVAYFFPAITEGRILAQHDAVAGIGAGREHQEYYEKHGKATRWTNSLFSGMPTYQLAPGYESSRTLNFVQEIYRLFLPTYAGYIFIMLLGFYILLRAFNF